MLQKLLKFAAWAGLCVIAYSTLSPLGDRPILLTSSKLEHLAAFAILGTLFCLAYPRRTVAVLLIVLGSAALLELLQFITPDRHARTLTHSKKLPEAPQAFSLAALSYVSIEHVSGCRAPQTPTHALKSAARISRVVLPELSRRPPTLDIVPICTIDRRVAKPPCAAVIVRLSWRPGNSSRQLHLPLAVRHDSSAPSSRQVRFES